MNIYRKIANFVDDVKIDSIIRKKNIMDSISQFKFSSAAKIRINIFGYCFYLLGSNLLVSRFPNGRLETSFIAIATIIGAYLFIDCICLGFNNKSFGEK